MKTSKTTAIFKAVFFAFVLLLVGSAAFGIGWIPGRPSAFNFWRLHNGMSEETVDGIMGTSHLYGEPGQHEVTHAWQNENDFYDAKFRDGKMIDKSHTHYHMPG